MTALVERRPCAPELRATAELAPCTCGGVLAWNPGARAWCHLEGLCRACAAAGNIYCEDTCYTPAPFCATPQPQGCANCGAELTTQGCPDCSADPAAVDPGADPDHAYDLLRERFW